MKMLSALVKTTVFVAAISAAAALAQTVNSAEAIDGRWDASVIGHGVVIPFRLDITGSGPTLKGILFDGSRPNNSTSSASFENGKLILVLEHYQTTITATLKDGKLVACVFFLTENVN